MFYLKYAPAQVLSREMTISITKTLNLLRILCISKYYWKFITSLCYKS